MSDLRIPLTDKNVERLPMANEGQYRARDTELRGFFVLVGLRTKTFMIQGDLYSGGRRQSVRRKIGDATKLSAREARAKAKVVLGSIANGDDPRAVPAAAVKVDAPTLREAWTRYRISHLIRKDRSVHTIHHYGDHVERLFADWLDTSLMDLGAKPMVVAERHETMTIRNGPAIANAAMRSLRAIYNHARRTCRELPAENPTFGVDWNLQRRKDTALGVKDLPAWFEQLAAIPNPVRREFQLLSLLSGSRPEALKSVRLEDVDFKRRVLHLRKPKGGEARAFDIPLSRAMLESLIRLRRLGPIVYPKIGEVWLFPSEAKSGHLEEHKADRQELSHWGNDLRQSYRTLGQAAGLSEVDMHLLMNHSLPGVNAGYITRAKLMSDHLRSQQETLSELILGAVVGHGRRPSAALSGWLNSTSRALLREMLLSNPDDLRRRLGPRSALRKLEIQAERCRVQNLDRAALDAPSRRLKTISLPDAG